MALRVWLPLNGTLENKGISNITVTNNGATINTNGKIGNCYSFSSNSLYGNLPGLNSMTQMSGCCWIYFTNLNSAQYIFHFGGQASYPCKFSLDYEGQLRSIINGTEYTSGVTLTTNTWYHITVTWNGSIIKWYVNGIERANKSTSGTFSASEHFAIGARTNSTAGTAFAYYITNAGRLNDIRIYDHCLSAAEVKEISQGLVLHYKLDSIGMLHGSENFILESHKVTSGSNAAGITSTYMDDGSLKVVAESGNSNYRSIGFAKNSNDNVGAKLSVGDTYTLSCDIKVESGTTLPTVFINSGNSYKRLQGNFILNQWTQVSYTSTWADPGTTYGNIALHLGFSGIVGTYYFKNFKLEKSPVPTKWCPSPLDDNYNSYDLTIIQDSSGYGYNGTIVGDLILNTETKRYSTSIKWNSSDPTTNNETGICYIQTPITLTTPLQMSITWWAKPENGYVGTTGNAALCTSNSTTRPTDYNSTAFHHRDNGFDIYPSDASGVKRLSFTYTKNEWHHYALTYDGTTACSYQDGIEKSSITIGTNKTLATFTQLYIGYSQAGGAKRKTLGSYSDFRIYCTALSAEDILTLYHTSAQVSNLGSLHTFEAVENASNIIFKIDSARGAQVFQDGLSRYTQANCQVTLTDQGYHIYRPPNLTTANDGNTMWGGLKLVNQTSDTIAAYTLPRDNCWNLQQGHTYLFAFHVKGQSSNGTSFGWSNNMGWGGGGVNATPTQIVNDGIPANFNGEKECIYIFTINDSISKTCTSSYSSYTANTTYLSYRHLTFGYGYSSTGELGTDIYLTNFRLYDITNFIGQIKKTGQANFSDFVENSNIAKILKNSEFLVNNLIER